MPCISGNLRIIDCFQRPKFMHLSRLILFPTFLIACSLAQNANSGSDPAQFSNETLIRSSYGWDGLPFAYPEGKPELTMMRLVLPEGHVLPMHCHPMPVIGYMLSGELEVTKPSGETTHYLQGQGVIEVFRNWHEGVAVRDSEIVVVYAGAQGMPLSVPGAADQPAAGGCQSPPSSPPAHPGTTE